MGLLDIFKIFKRRKAKSQDGGLVGEDAERYNRMWDRWAEGKIGSPLAELMTYQAEVNNGGHDQFFHNMNVRGVLQKTLAELNKILPSNHKRNLKLAYDTYKKYGDDYEKSEPILDKCDDFFYENEESINQILENCSKNKIIL